MGAASVRTLVGDKRSVQLKPVCPEEVAGVDVFLGFKSEWRLAFNVGAEDGASGNDQDATAPGKPLGLRGPRFSRNSPMPSSGWPLTAARLVGQRRGRGASFVQLELVGQGLRGEPKSSTSSTRMNRRLPFANPEQPEAGR